MLEKAVRVPSLTFTPGFDIFTRVKINEIRAKIKAGRFSITDHALTESFKDGVTITDPLCPDAW